MKWIFATLVALNLIVFAGFVGNKIMNPKKPQPQVVQAPQQPQAPQQIIINTGNGTPTTVSTNGTVTTNGVPAGSAIGKIVGRTANTVRPQRNANANNTGASLSAGSGKTAQTAAAEPRAKYRACSARVSIPEDDYHRIKGLLGKFPHAASRQPNFCPHEYYVYVGEQRRGGRVAKHCGALWRVEPHGLRPLISDDRQPEKQNKRFQAAFGLCNLFN